MVELLSCSQLGFHGHAACEHACAAVLSCVACVALVHVWFTRAPYVVSRVGVGENMHAQCCNWEGLSISMAYAEPTPNLVMV